MATMVNAIEKQQQTREMVSTLWKLTRRVSELLTIRENKQHFRSCSRLEDYQKENQFKARYISQCFKSLSKLCIIKYN